MRAGTQLSRTLALHNIEKIGDGRKTVAAAGTAEALASNWPCENVYIQAELDNTGIIVVGGPTVVAAAANRRGIALAAGESCLLEVDNLAEVYIDATVNGDGVTFIAGGLEAIGDIGVAGQKGFGVGICKNAPAGFSRLAGTLDIDSDDYGNYQYQDGSIMVWIPKFYYRMSHASNPTYGDYGVNSVDIKGVETYANAAAASADGYALHRAFIDGGSEQDGFFVDKYMCSQNTYDGDEIASSIKNGNPISTNAAHNPIADLTACSGNAHYETINAAGARGSRFHVASRLQHAALALIAMAHGQASSDATYCAWYDATNNFPKGCNNDALGDTDDGTVSYTSDGYSNCGKTGSGTPFAKTTHNGQASGVADINGLMWEVSLGVTAIVTTQAIEGMTRADPCVVTWTGHGLTTGDYVMIGDTDITQADWTALNDKIFAITKIDNDSFSLDGVDSSGFAADYNAGTDPGQIHKATFYTAKQATAMKDFTSGDSEATDHWGAAGVAAMMDAFAPAFETGYPNNGYPQRYGSGENQVLSEEASGADWLLTGLGLPKDKDAIDTTGTNLFGKDYFYQYLRDALCLRSCGAWSPGSGAGVWDVAWDHYRTHSHYNVGFRAACYLD